MNVSLSLTNLSLLVLVCKAICYPIPKWIISDSNGNYKCLPNISRSNIESLLLQNVKELASDVVRIRETYSVTETPLYNVFNTMHQQIVHLDNLCTQTRALLTRQAEIISKIRKGNMHRRSPDKYSSNISDDI